MVLSCANCPFSASMVATGVALRTLHTCSTRDADKHIISDPPTIAAAFACAVTVHADRESLVARNGDLSVFSAYKRIFPQARPRNRRFPNRIKHYSTYSSFSLQACQQGSRKCPIKGKIARLEFNKVLQSKCGFKCSRSRKKPVSM